MSGDGIVGGGTVMRGTIKEGDKLQCGPTDDGRFYNVTVSSIHRNRQPCRVVSAGQAASIQFTPPSECAVRRVCKSGCSFFPDNFLCGNIKCTKLKKRLNTQFITITM